MACCGTRSAQKSQEMQIEIHDGTLFVVVFLERERERDGERKIRMKRATGRWRGVRTARVDTCRPNDCTTPPALHQTLAARARLVRRAGTSHEGSRARARRRRAPARPSRSVSPGLLLPGARGALFSPAALHPQVVLSHLSLSLSLSISLFYAPFIRYLGQRVDVAAYTLDRRLLFASDLGLKAADTRLMHGRRARRLVLISTSGRSGGGNDARASSHKTAKRDEKSRPTRLGSVRV